MLNIALARQSRTAPQLADAMLLLVAVIWGSSYAATKQALAFYPVLGFIARRRLDGSASRASAGADSAWGIYLRNTGCGDYQRRKCGLSNQPVRYFHSVGGMVGVSRTARRKIDTGGAGVNRGPDRGRRGRQLAAAALHFSTAATLARVVAVLGDHLVSGIVRHPICLFCAKLCRRVVQRSVALDVLRQGRGTTPLAPFSGATGNNLLRLPALDPDAPAFMMTGRDFPINYWTKSCWKFASPAARMPIP